MDSHWLEQIKNQDGIGLLHKRIIIDREERPVDCEILEVNKGFEKIIGFATEKIIGRSGKEVFSVFTDDPADWIDLFGQIALQGGQETFDHYAANLQRLFRIHTYCTEQHYCTSLFLDITPDSEAIRTLIEKEKFYRGLIESQNDLIIRADIHNRITFVNKRYCEVFGRTPEQWKGESFVPMINEEDRALTMTAIESLKKPPHRAEIEQRVLTDNGTRWIFWEGTAIFNNHGEIKEIQSVGRDITDEKKNAARRDQLNRKIKESEKKYRALFEASTDGIIKTDLQGNIEEANPAFLSLLGYDKDPDAMPVSLGALTPEHWKNLEESIYQSDLFPNGFTREYEKEFFCKDGGTVPVSMKTWLIQNEGHVSGMWSIVRDISKHKDAELKLRQAFQMLEYLNHYKVDAREKERKALAGIIHDEIGQTMTALRFELESLGISLPQKKEIRYKLDKLTTMISQTIHMAQRLSEDLRPVLLDELGLQPALEKYARDIEASTGLSVRLKTCHFFIKKHVELALFRIIQEAVTNTLRHGKAHTITITLNCTEKNLHLAVKDDGKGIPEEKINDRYSFGLMGMQERAQMVGGDFNIKSENGTLIEVIIPFNQQDRCKPTHENTI